MSEREVFELLLRGFVLLAVVTFVALLFVVAPYGRHLRRGYGPLVNGTAGWVTMEATAALLPLVLFLLAPPAELLPWVALGLWELHYLHRAFVYPFRRRTAGLMPVLVVALGALFNLVNAYLNARWLTVLAPPPGVERLTSPSFAAGVALFLAGFAINQHSDLVLLRLRARGEGGYKVPHEGLHRLVASPNYTGELVEWSGFALLTGSPAALVFALWTAANLVPRALSNLRWYRTTFPDYPRERRALVPFVL
jgi:3-oxo-5-alpha-steroid 4-dehydrogenase 1